jgi:hypothetical protein
MYIQKFGMDFKRIETGGLFVRKENKLGASENVIGQKDKAHKHSECQGGERQILWGTRHQSIGVVLEEVMK